jgi:hypothetical protein
MGSGYVRVGWPRGAALAEIAPQISTARGLGKNAEDKGFPLQIVGFSASKIAARTRYTQLSAAPFKDFRPFEASVRREQGSRRTCGGKREC